MLISISFRLRVVPFSSILCDAKENYEKKWPRELLGARRAHLTPGFRAAIFFRGFVLRHARRTKRKRDYSFCPNVRLHKGITIVLSLFRSHWFNSC